MESKRSAALPAAILLYGAFNAWCRRDSIYSDGIAYLEIAEAYLQGRWSEALNAYWSPLYSWLLAAVFSIVRPQVADELGWLHAVNFVLLCVAAWTFRFLLRELARFDEIASSRVFHTVAWLTFGWATLPGRMTGLFRPLPDLGVTAIVFAAAALLLRVRRSQQPAVTGAALGALLGVGYLAKTALLPVGLLMLACSGRWRAAVSGAAVMAAVAAPFVLAISGAKGRLTVGDSGPINYAWEVGPVRRSVHWQGEEPGYGSPAHPTRVLHRRPLLAEFASPVPGSYPPWRDPSYWYEGVRPRFEWRGQLASFYLNGRYAAVLFFLCPAVLAAMAALLRRSWRRPNFAPLWFLLVPCAAAVLMYSAVFVEGRYIAGFLAVAGLCVAAPVFRVSPRVRAAIPLAAVGLVFTMLGDFVLDGTIVARKLTGSQRPWHGDLAEEMRRLGVPQGARIGYIGLSINAYWVRLAGARVVCEIPIEHIRKPNLSRAIRDGDAELAAFWKSPPEVRARILELMRRSGAQFAVADMAPEWADTTGWTQLQTRLEKAYGDDRTFLIRLDARCPGSGSC